MSKWIKGVPTRPGHYWCYFEDQGGWPWVEYKEARMFRDELVFANGLIPVKDHWKLFFHMEIEKPGLPTEEDHAS